MKKIIILIVCNILINSVAFAQSSQKDLDLYKITKMMEWKGKKSLPFEIDKDSVLTDIVSDGTTLRYIVKFKASKQMHLKEVKASGGTIEEEKEFLRSSNINKLCNMSSVKDLVNAGMYIDYQYKFPDGEVFVVVQINKFTCENNHE
jgi:hypothetical protein